MYGLVMQNFSGYLTHKYGADAWDNIRRLSSLDNATFTVHQVIKKWVPSNSIWIQQKMFEAFCCQNILLKMYCTFKNRSTQNNCWVRLPKKHSAHWDARIQNFLKKWDTFLFNLLGNLVMEMYWPFWADNSGTFWMV